ncbi:MAG: ABC transporter permease [Oscillospiraceae bacterium]
MAKYIFKRILMMIPVLFGVLLLVFTMLSFAKGDPAQYLAGADATEEAVQQLRDKWGLDDPYFVRLWNYIKQLVIHFDLGTSYRTGLSVSSEIISRFWVTLSLALSSVALSLIIGVALGVLSATHQGTALDSAAIGVSLVGASVPDFLVALLCSLLFALKLQWLPASGWGELKFFILPVATFAVSRASTLARQTRSAMLEVIRQDYIVTAKAKGVTPFKVVFKHALRNALVPIVTQAGLILGGAIGGAVVAETIFSIPGLGTYILTAVKSRDYPVVQGGVLFTAFGFGIIMLLVDVLYAFIDPRVGARYKKPAKEKNS